MRYEFTKSLEQTSLKPVVDETDVAFSALPESNIYLELWVSL